MINPEIEEVKRRLARLEEAVFGMDYETANHLLNSYIEASKENPRIDADVHVKTAEKMLGV